MAAKCMPYFILTADGVAMPSSSEESSDFANSTTDSFMDGNSKTRNKKARKTKKKILTVSTRMEATKSRMEFIKQKLDESRERYNQKQIASSKAVPRMKEPKPHLMSSDQSDKSSERSVELVPISHTKGRGSHGALPYVYFVVSVDRTATIKPTNDFEFLSEIAPGSPFMTKKPKDKFLMSRSEMRKMQQEERKRLKQAASEIGLKSEPIRAMSQKQIIFPASSRSPPLNPPTTPATTFTSALNFDKPDDSMTLPEEVDVSDFLDSRPSTKRCATRFLELPHISADEQRKNLGTAPASVDYKPMELMRRTVSTSSGNRRVHFSDGFPLITGSTITFSDLDAVRSSLGSRPSTMPALMSKGDRDDKSRENRERDRPKFSRTKTSPLFSKKHSESLNLPKIDIVSNVYNDLIIKAINAYIKQFPVGSQQTKLAKQLIQQIEEHCMNSSDIFSELSQGGIQIHPGTNERRVVIKEIDPGLSDMIQGQCETNGKMAGNRVKPNPRKERQYNSLTPKSFKMAPPGLKKEQTNLSVR